MITAEEAKEAQELVADFARVQRAATYAECLFCQNRWAEAAEILSKMRPIMEAMEDKMSKKSTNSTVVKKVSPKIPKDNRGVKPNPKGGSTGK